MDGKRRISTMAITLVGVAASLLGPDVAVAAPVAARPSDFNGDGYADLAIGVPLEDLGSKRDAGAVNVIYGSASGLRSEGDQLWSQDSAGVIGKAQGRRRGHDADNFGWALASGDFDGDGYADLAIGVPGDVTGEGTGGVLGEGAVNVLYGSKVGLTANRDQRWMRSDLPDATADHVGFGTTLAVGDFDGDTYPDLVITEDFPSRTIGILRGGPGGLTSSSGLVLRQAQFIGVEGDSEGFGAALVAGDLDGDGRDDLAASVDTDCGEDLDGEYSCIGAVGVLYGSPGGPTSKPQVWSQDSPGILDEVTGREESFGSSLAIGDFDEDGFGDLAIGNAFEDVGPIAMAGAVNVVYGSAAGLSADGNQYWDETLPGVPGTAEAGGTFGQAMAAGDLNGDGADDLAIGVPGDGGDDDVWTGPGAVVALYGSSAGLAEAGAQRWTQASPGVPDARGADDQFGSRLVIGDFGRSHTSDLAIGVPYERLSGVPAAGMVNVLYGRSSGLSGVGAQGWSQGTPGIKGIVEHDDLFGWNLAN